MPDPKGYQNVLCIRADNMGDVIMSSPAFRALKQTFGSHITLLTSSAGAIVAPYLECVDDVLIFDLPWVQNTGLPGTDLLPLIELIRERNFDAAIIFTVNSQSALPAAMLVFMAGIPVRVAYGRENPYSLLTDWVPDQEPYEIILHQVNRDIALVAQIGAAIIDDYLSLKINGSEQESCSGKLSNAGVNIHSPYLIFHPGVSEQKRQYRTEYWIQAGKMLAEKYGIPILISGSDSEKGLSQALADGIGLPAISVAGLFSLGEFISFVANAACVVSVNTGTIHIAAATQTPVVVLYAQTNPQHSPWKCAHRIIPFPVPEHLKSRNTVIKYVSDQVYSEPITYPGPEKILSAVEEIYRLEA